MYGQTDRWMDEWIDRQMDVSTDRWMDEQRQTDGWTAAYGLCKNI